MIPARDGLLMEVVVGTNARHDGRWDAANRTATTRREVLIIAFNIDDGRCTCCMVLLCRSIL